MTEETKVEVELHDEDINDIVEETLEEETVEEALLILNYSTRVRKKTNLRNQWTAEDAVKKQLLLLRQKRA